MQYYESIRVFINTILGPQGLILAEAQGKHKVSTCYLDFMKVVRGFVTIRFVGPYTQDIEEVYIYIYIYDVYKWGLWLWALGELGYSMAGHRPS